MTPKCALIIFIAIYSILSAEGMENEHKYHLKRNDFGLSDSQKPQVFINQSDTLFILAKFGQTVSLPCIVIRQKTQEAQNIHVIWKKLHHHHRPGILSIGNNLLKHNMRFIVKKTDLDNKGKEIKTQANRRQLYNRGQSEVEYSNEKWSFVIRKLTYEDAGTYQCFLPLVEPIFKNITLQVIPDLKIEPAKKNYKTSETIEIDCEATLRTPNKRRKHARKYLRQQRPHISWYKENDLLKNDHNASATQKIKIHTERYENKLRSKLTIRNANVIDSGKYRCIFENIQEHSIIKISDGEYSYKNLQSSFFSNKSNRPVSSTKLLYTLLITFGLLAYFGKS